MRRVTLPNPPPSMHSTVEGKFVLGALRDIERASYESDPALIATDFSVTNFTETRTLDVGTATLTDLKNFVATFIYDMQRGGAKKG
jgi:hypothetical protein